MKLLVSAYIFTLVKSQYENYEAAPNLEPQNDYQSTANKNDYTDTFNIDEVKNIETDNAYETEISPESQSENPSNQYESNEDASIQSSFQEKESQYEDTQTAEALDLSNPTAQSTIDQLTTMINELEDKIAENEGEESPNDLVDSQEINIDINEENSNEINESDFETAPAEISQVEPQPETSTLTESDSQSELMKKMMAMMTPEQLAQLNGNAPNAEAPAASPSSFLGSVVSSLNPFGYDAPAPEPAGEFGNSFVENTEPRTGNNGGWSEVFSSKPEPPQEKHIFDPRVEQAAASLSEHTSDSYIQPQNTDQDPALNEFRSSQNALENQPLLDNPPAIDAFNQGYPQENSPVADSFGQGYPQETTPDLDTFGQEYPQGNQQPLADNPPAIDAFNQGYPQESQENMGYQNTFNMAGVPNSSLMENQESQLVENQGSFQNLPMPPQPMAMEEPNDPMQYQQQPFSSQVQPDQQQEQINPNQFYNPNPAPEHNTQALQLSETDIPTFETNPFASDQNNLSFEQNNPSQPITSDFNYNPMPDQVQEQLPVIPESSEHDFNEMRQEVTLEEKLGSISQNLPYNVNLSPTQRPLNPSFNGFEAPVQSLEPNQYGQQDANPAAYDQNPSQYENEPAQYGQAPSKLDPYNENQEYQAGPQESDLQQYDTQLAQDSATTDDENPPVESNVGSFKPPAMPQRFDSKNIYEKEYFEDGVSSHSWMIFIILCCVAFVGLMRRKFRKLGLAAAKGGRNRDRGATEGGFDAVYKPLRDEDDMA